MASARQIFHLSSPGKTPDWFFSPNTTKDPLWRLPPFFWLGISMRAIWIGSHSQEMPTILIWRPVSWLGSGLSCFSTCENRHVPTSPLRCSSTSCFQRMTRISMLWSWGTLWDLVITPQSIFWSFGRCTFRKFVRSNGNTSRFNERVHGHMVASWTGHQ